MDMKVERRWVHNGLECVILLLDIAPETTLPSYRCGYVGVPKEHPLYGVHYTSGHPKATEYWEKIASKGQIGGRGVIPLFLFAQSGEEPTLDVIFDVHGSITFSDKKTVWDKEGTRWWFGFDCSHSDDVSNPKSHEYVVAECEKLADQLRLVEGEITEVIRKIEL